MIGKFLCDVCQNAEICKYCDEYKKVYYTVADGALNCENADGSMDIRRVKEVPFVDVDVNCKYHLREPMPPNIGSVFVKKI